MSLLLLFRPQGESGADTHDYAPDYYSKPKKAFVKALPILPRKLKAPKEVKKLLSPLPEQSQKNIINQAKAQLSVRKEDMNSLLDQLELLEQLVLRILETRKNDEEMFLALLAHKKYINN